MTIDEVTRYKFWEDYGDILKPTPIGKIYNKTR